MKRILQSLFVVIILLLLNACQQKQFGHLSKVRVKQNSTQQIAKEKKEVSKEKEVEITEIEKEEELISAEADSTITLVGSTRNLIGSKPSKNAEVKDPQPKKDNPKKRSIKAPDDSFKPNIPAYIGLGLSAISALGILIDLTLWGDGYLALIGFLLVIPILILGIVGYSNYRRERASDGYAAALASIIYSSIVVLFFVVLFIIVLLFLLTGGFY